MDTTETPRTPWTPRTLLRGVPCATPQKPTDNAFAHGRRSVCAFDVGVVSIHSHRRPRQWAPRCSNSSAVSEIRGVSGVCAATDTAAAAICTATGLRSPAAAAEAGASGAAAAAASAATTVFAHEGAANPGATALCGVHGVGGFAMGVGRFAIACVMHQRGVHRRPCEGPTAGCACL